MLVCRVVAFLFYVRFQTNYKPSSHLERKLLPTHAAFRCVCSMEKAVIGDKISKVGFVTQPGHSRVFCQCLLWIKAALDAGTY